MKDNEKTQLVQQGKLKTSGTRDTQVQKSRGETENRRKSQFPEISATYPFLKELYTEESHKEPKQWTLRDK
jgi:hypothetical protein